jgi:UDP-N-acetylmuramate dehydrogenase
VRSDFPLAPATLYNIGGPARVALLPRNAAEVREAWEWMVAQPVPRLILGGGSNVLISDEGFPGIVLFTTHLTDFKDLGGSRYQIGSGVPLAKLVRDIMLPNNYDGVGALTGIPGSVGGAIYMNAGTANGSTCEFMESVDLMSAEGLRTVVMDPSLYTYRGQNFCGLYDVILGGVFQFSPAAEDQRAVFDHYMKRRREKQPQGHSCGSVFKNPEGDHAGRLIESCGLKGTRRGGAVISPLHANFIMNEEHASFDDVFALIQLAKSRVLEQFGIELEEEVRIIRLS